MLRYIYIDSHAAIPMYNLLVGIGIAAAMLFLQYEKDFRKKSIAYRQRVHEGLFFSLILGFAGAFALDAYTQGIPFRITEFRRVGLTFFGGLVTGFIVLVVYLRLRKLPVKETLDVLTLPVCLAHGIGRLGCFFAGCCYGKPTETFWGVVFPVGSLPYVHFQAQVPLFPTQLFESGFVLILFAVIWGAKIRNRFIAYVTAYSIFRFFIEFLRADSRGILFSQTVLSPSQIISMIVFLSAVFFVFFQRHRFKKRIVFNNIKN